MYYKFLKDFVNRKEGEVYELHPSLGANLVARDIAVKVNEDGSEIDQEPIKAKVSSKIP